MSKASSPGARMSKAAEYVARVQAANDVPQFRAHVTDSGWEWFGSVSGRGDLELRGTLPAKDALAFAAWIRDTFGEPERSGIADSLLGKAEVGSNADLPIEEKLKILDEAFGAWGPEEDDK